MARWPAAGRCKRRLAASCGITAAAAMQQRLTAHTIAAARAAAGACQASVVLAATGLGPRARQRWSQQLGLERSVDQGPGNLGCRMQRQLRRAFGAGASQVVLVGSDLPGLEAADLQAAFAGLEQHELVLGPAQDGGYWLIGLNRPGFARAGAHLMVGIPWGSDAVLHSTHQQAQRLGLLAVELRRQADLDRSDALAPWLQPAPWRRWRH